MLFLRNLLNQSAGELSPRTAEPTPTTTNTTAPNNWDYNYMPQEVLDYFGSGKNGMYDRYTDSNGFQWLQQWEGGGGIGDSSDGSTPFLAAYRRSELANEANDPFRAETVNHYYSPQGKYSYTNKDDPGWLNPLTGIAAVAGLGVLAPALFGGAAAAGAGGAAAGTSTAGATGAGLGSYAAAPGASIGGSWFGSGVGSGAAGYGLGSSTGLGAASTYGGAAIGSGLSTSLAAGAGALGNSGGAIEGTPPPSNPYTAPASPQGVPPPANPYAPASVLEQLGTQGGKALISQLLQQGGGGGNQGTGMGLNDIIGMIGGGVDASRQGDASQKMLEWLQGQSQKMESAYQPGSPEYEQLWQAMSRKDAAAGRNSQYGPRTADFLSQIAKSRADNIRQFTTGNSLAYANAINQDASKYAGLSSAAQRAAMSGRGFDLGSLVSQLGDGNWLNSLFGANGGSTTGGPTEADVWDFMFRNGE